MIEVIDEGIVDLLAEINSYDNIMTLHSCADEPYLCFLLNEKGWNIFWTECIADIIPLIYVANPLGGKCESRCVRFSVGINTYIEHREEQGIGTDYAYITLRGEPSEFNNIFWERIRNSFKKLK